MADGKGADHPYPNLTPEHYRQNAVAFRTQPPCALPHRHQPGGDLCTSRRCLTEAGHLDYHCAKGRTKGEYTCYDADNNFACWRSTKHNRHCRRRRAGDPLATQVPQEPGPNPQTR